MRLTIYYSRLLNFFLLSEKTKKVKMSELLGVLEKTQNPAELQNASKFLEEAARGNLPLFLKELSKSKQLISLT